MVGCCYSQGVDWGTGRVCDGVGMPGKVPARDESLVLMETQLEQIQHLKSDEGCKYLQNMHHICG